MDAETEAVQIGKLRQLPSGEWYVHCRWCEKEAHLHARNEDEAYGMLEEWRLSMPRRQYKDRNWSCPSCRVWWDKPEASTVNDGYSWISGGGSSWISGPACRRNSNFVRCL